MKGKVSKLLVTRVQIPEREFPGRTMCNIATDIMSELLKRVNREGKKETL